MQFTTETRAGVARVTHLGSREQEGRVLSDLEWKWSLILTPPHHWATLAFPAGRWVGLGCTPWGGSQNNGRCWDALSPGAASGRTGQSFGQFPNSHKRCASEPWFGHLWTRGKPSRLIGYIGKELLVAWKMLGGSQPRGLLNCCQPEVGMTDRNGGQAWKWTSAPIESHSQESL